MRACSGDLMLSSEGGDGPRRVSFIYNQVRSLWLTLVPRESESGLCVCAPSCGEDMYIPELCYRVKIKKQNRIVKLKVFKHGGVVYSFNKE